MGLSGPCELKIDARIALDPDPEIGFIIIRGIHSGGILKIFIIGDKIFFNRFIIPDEFSTVTAVIIAMIAGRIEIIHCIPSFAPSMKELKISIFL